MDPEHPKTSQTSKQVENEHYHSIVSEEAKRMDNRIKEK